MKKSQKKPKHSTVDRLDLSWGLHDHPSAQFTAGLAGLLMMIEHLHETKEARGVLTATCTETELRVSMDQTGLESLVASLYASEAVATNSKKSDSPSEIKYLRGSFLASYEPSDAHPWLKLWRDCMREIPYSSPRARSIYETHPPSKTAEKLWRELVKDAALGLSGPIMLASTEATHEGVPVRSGTRASFPLRFWPYACAVYIAQAQTYHPTHGLRYESRGYVIAIPDVLDLRRFPVAWRGMLAARSPRRAGFRPADAIIAAIDEAPLLLEASLLEQIEAQTWSRRNEVFDFVGTVEVYRCLPTTKQPKFLARQLTPGKHHLMGYAVARGYRDYELRAQRIVNLMTGRHWASGMAEILTRMPKAERELKAWTLDHDVRHALATEKDDEMKRATMEIVYDLISQYMRRRVAERHNDTPWAKLPPDERKKRIETIDHVRNHIFFGLRNKTDSDVVGWLAETLSRYGYWLDLSELQQVLEDPHTRHYVLLCSQLRPRKESIEPPEPEGLSEAAE